MKPVYLADVGGTDFENQRGEVDVVCAGDSITSWNNFGPADCWPYPTYPQFLQLLCAGRGLRVADGGVAGEVSDNGPRHVRRYLDLFPNACSFIIGFGTNDLGTWPDLESTSRRIIENLDEMVRAVRDREKQPMLLNVPHANEPMFPPQVARDLHEKRDYHNHRLGEYCQENEVPLVDICACLGDEHFGDELHPNERGARMIAEEVFKILSRVHQ